MNAETTEARFILVDPGADAANTSGRTGTIGISNVYLCAYADYADHPHPRTLRVGERTQATFRLGGKGTYDIVRVA